MRTNQVGSWRRTMPPTPELLHIMTAIDRPTQNNNPEHERRILHELQDMFATMTEITQRHAKSIPGGVFSLDEAAQQDLISAINPYCRFEFTKHPDVHNLPVTATGTGMFFLSDFEGNILGAEQLFEGDVITGHIKEVCVLPTPTIDCLARAYEGSIPVDDQVLSPILILEDSQFKAGLTSSGSFETEMDLSGHQVGIPLLHYVRITNAT